MADTGNEERAIYGARVAVQAIRHRHVVRFAAEMNEW